MPSLFNVPEVESRTPFNTKKQKPGAKDSGKEALLMASTIQGNYQRNATMWQIIALVSLLSFFISLAIVAYAVHLPKTVPVVVTVNGEGKANYIGPVTTSGKATIPEIAKTYQIKRFVERMNTWITDRNGQNLLIEDAQALVQSGAIQQLDLFLKQNNPFDNFGQRIRIVTLSEPLRQSENVYFCRYETTLKTSNGGVIAQEPWTMLVTLGYYQPSPQNPLGLYITNFDIQPANN